SLLIVLTACSKESIPQKNLKAYADSGFVAQQTSLFSSGWESVSDWKSEKNENGISFYYSRATPQLNKSVLNDGIVVVFARNLWADEAAFKNMGAADKPLRMPFYFLPFFEKPDYTEHWSYSTDENKINVLLSIKGETESSTPNSKVQFRFII